MTFNSWAFFASFFAFAALYYPLRSKSWEATKWLILFYSYLFYGFWNYYFVALLLTSTLVDYVVALLLERYPAYRRLLAGTSLTLNLGALGFFKYANFAVETTEGLADLWGLSLDVSLSQIVLPVGISFYTFQTLSYTLDVYRGQLPANRRFVDIAVFVAFFPQLVAGPIVRARQFLPQVAQAPKITLRQVHRGIFFVVTGLFWKAVVADGVAPQVERLFADYESGTSADAWIAGALFGVQIFGDFNGYSLIAIGLASILGFQIPKNFDSPYAAVSFSDFWRRWHISLSTWLRDYLYVALGGNRHGEIKRVRNLVITMGLGGLWHGAAAHFIVWGLVHAGLLVIQNAVVRLVSTTGLFRRLRVARPSRPPAGCRPAGLLLLARHSAMTVWAAVIFSVVSLTWILFRATDINHAAGLFEKISEFDMRFQLATNTDLLIILGVFALSMSDRLYGLWRRVMWNRYLYGLWIALSLIGLYFLSGQSTTFIYFQF